jgi:hypothetical protein
MHGLVMLLQGVSRAKVPAAKDATEAMLCSLMRVSPVRSLERTITVNAFIVWVLRFLMLVSSVRSLERPIAVTAFIVWVLQFLMRISSC